MQRPWRHALVAAAAVAVAQCASVGFASPDVEPTTAVGFAVLTRGAEGAAARTGSSSEADERNSFRDARPLARCPAVDEWGPTEHDNASTGDDSDDERVQRRAVLTTSCPSECGETASLCIAYPTTAQAQCVTSGNRVCYVDAAAARACAYECLSSTSEPTSWAVTVYTDDTIVTETTTPTLVNASVVTSLSSGVLAFPDALRSFSLTGNQVAATGANSTRKDDWGYPARGYDVTRADRVAFALPATLLQDLRELRAIRIENVLLPSQKANVDGDTAPVLDQLTHLSLRNTGLKTLPLPRSSIPALEELDVSMNEIRRLPSSAFPRDLISLNLSMNALSRIAPDSLPGTLRVLDLSYNAIESFPSGTLPLGLSTLSLINTGLFKVPRDVQDMGGMAELFLDHNPLGSFARNAVPPVGVTSLGLRNCSLTDIPHAVQAMVDLEALYLSANDFSDGPDFTRIRSSVATLELADCKLQGLPSSFAELDTLETLSLAQNPSVMQDISMLPSSLRSLDLSDSALTTVPTAVSQLKNLQVLDLLTNPITSINPNDLPSKLSTLTLSHAAITNLPADTLPSSLTALQIADSGLKTIPEDLSSLTGLTDISITRCQLSALDDDVFHSLDKLQTIDLHGNTITTFSSQLPSHLLSLDLRDNALESFTVPFSSSDSGSSPSLEQLQLASNALTFLPDSLWEFSSLRVLNLSGNPIQDYTPTRQEYAFLSALEVLVMEQDMFASSADCDSKDKLALHGRYVICGSALRDGSGEDDEGSVDMMMEAERGSGDGAVARASGSSSIWVALLNVCLVALVCVLVAVVWRRHRVSSGHRHAHEHATLAHAQQQELERPSAAILAVWQTPLLLGHRLSNERLVRHRLLGSGLFGEVWLASYKQERVAVKTLRGSGDGSVLTTSVPTEAAAAAARAGSPRNLLDEFVEEITLVATLRHPRIVAFRGVVWTKASDLALVTEYVSGGDLRTYLDDLPERVAGLDGSREDGPGTGGAEDWDATRTQIALDIADALVYLHAREPAVVHGDLKSRNVLLDHEGRAKLTDFGISRDKRSKGSGQPAGGDGKMGEDKDQDKGMRWLAPEVLAGEGVDRPVDVFALGVILFEMNTGQLPRSQVGQAPMAVASMLTASCPREIASLVTCCTALNAGDRPTAAQVAEELRSFLELRGGSEQRQ